MNETLQFDNISSDKEYDYGNQNQESKNLEWTDKETVESSHERQHSVSTEKPVDDDLDYLNINDYKTSVN